MNKEITILTPTFNRANTLPRLYQSLCKQTFKNFVWLIIDDGSTDNTVELVKKWQQEGILEIQYHWQENTKKLIATVRGFKKVQTPYLYSVDSDDSLPIDSLQILYDEMLLIKNDDKYSSVIGRIEDQNGEIKGTPFPKDQFDSTWFHLVNRDKVQGPHEGLMKTQSIKKTLIDVEGYLGKGYVYDVWNFYLDANFITRFINNVVYTYYLDESDEQSLTNTKYAKKNAYGLSETHKHYLEAYSNTYFKSYPLPIIKQLFKYLYFGLNVKGLSFFSLVKKLNQPTLKIIAYLISPIIIIYYLIKPLEK